MTARPNPSALDLPLSCRVQPPLMLLARVISLLHRKKGLDAGIAKGKEEALKGEIKLKKSIGLGPQPNVIPPAEAEIKADLRDVSIGWHPVPGAKWFADSTRLGKYITKEVGKYPDPTQHWAVLVGEYCHQLWMVSQGV